jgi:hypothetical protein
MADSLKLFKKFSTQMNLFALVVMVIFASLVRPPEKISDIEVLNDHLYIALGERGVRVLNISKPGLPTEVGKYDTFDSANALGLRKVGANEFLYVADGKAGVLAFDVTAHQDPVNQWDLKKFGNALDIVIKDQYAFIARGKDGISVLNLNKHHESSEFSLDLALENGAERVAINQDTLFILDSNENLNIIDISKPQKIEDQEITIFSLEGPVNDLTIYRNNLYIATEGNGLQVVNIANPADIPPVFKFTEFESVQSVAVHGSFAYLSVINKGLQAVDISDLNEMVILGETVDDIDLHSPQKIFLHNDYLYVGDDIQGLKTLRTDLILDVRRPDMFGSQGSTQGWVHDVVIVKNKYAYIAGDERGLWIIKVSDPEEPEEVPFFDKTGGHAKTIALHGDFVYVGYKGENDKHKVQQFVLSETQNLPDPRTFEIGGEPQGLDVEGEFLFVAADKKGLCIINISPDSTFTGNAPDPICKGTKDRALGVDVVGNLAYIASGQGGLEFVLVQDKTLPTIVTHGDNIAGYPQNAQAVVMYPYKPNKDAAEIMYAYVADGSGGVGVLNVTDPQNPSVITVLETSDFASDVHLRITDNKKRLYVTDSSDGLIVFDIANPANPVRISSLATPGEAVAVATDEDFVYIADYNRGLQIINQMKEDQLKIEGFFDLPTQIKDIALWGRDYGYLVDGHGGLWVVNLADLGNPIPSGYKKMPGQANGVTVSDKNVFVADGNKGLQVVSLDPLDPTIEGSLEQRLLDTRAVHVREPYALVAEGGGGLHILTISNTQNITFTGHFPTQGVALNVDTAGNYAYVVSTDGKMEIANISDPEKPTYASTFIPITTIISDTKNILVDTKTDRAYVSDGINGIVIFNVENPFEPKLVAEWDTPGIAMDVAVTDHYLFTADGSNGIDIIYMPELDQFELGKHVSFSELGANEDTAKESEADDVDSCKANALNIEVIPHHVKAEENEAGSKKKVVHFYVYVATDQCGLQTIDVVPKINLLYLNRYITPGDATFGMVITSYFKALTDTVIDTYENRGTVSWFKLPILGWEFGIENYLEVHPRIHKMVKSYILGFFFLTTGTLFWLALFAFFVLPVRQPNDGWQAFIRLVLYMLGWHGPIVSALEGLEKGTSSVNLSEGKPGVVRVDLNSAVAVEEIPVVGIWGLGQRRLKKKRLEKSEKTYQARAEGPGILFTKAYERVKGVADLRPQFRGRPKIHFNSRDGIELYTNFVFTSFTLGDPPDVLPVTYEGSEEPKNIRVIFVKDGQVVGLNDHLDEDDKLEIHRFVQTARYKSEEDLEKSAVKQSQLGPFLFDEERVFKAISSKPFDVREKEIKEWTELPPHAAVGIVRNLIGKELFDNISKPADPKDFPLIKIKSELTRQLRNMGVLAYKYFENLDGSPIQKDQPFDKDNLKEFPPQDLKTPKPLRARGIKVRFSGFTELFPKDKAVQRQLIEYWRSEWQKDAMILQADYSLQGMRIRSQARAQTQRDLVNTLGMILSDESYSKEALAMRVLQALESAATDPNTQRLLPRDTIQLLRNINEMLLPGDDQKFIEDRTEEEDDDTSPGRI